jgi:hypothetical protein
MRVINNYELMRAMPNALIFSQEQVNLILGYSLKNIYEDVLREPLPGHLKTLVSRLEE